MHDKAAKIKHMIETIQNEVTYTRHMIGRDRLAPQVIEAMLTVPRDVFVPDDLKFSAFDNGPLPIGHGQTISQPYMVALMTDLLEIKPDFVVLEIGTGSGYQTAILSKLCRQVYTIEVIPALAEAACQRFKDQGYTNIESRIGNGYEGWVEYAPYDGIIVTAAATHIPQTLKDQLKPDRRMVIPIGLPYMHQELMLVEKNHQAEIHVSDILDVSFVPLVN